VLVRIHPVSPESISFAKRPIGKSRRLLK